jgi:hypothetical protein
MGTRIDENAALADVLRLIDDWRTYRRMLAQREIPIDRDHYARLVRDLAMVIRGRVML